MINEKRLNLACGQNKVDGYFGIDIKKGENVDAEIDLELFPWPIESESAEEIMCSHYIEHTSTDIITKQIQQAIIKSNNFDEFKELISKIDFNEPSDGLIKFMDEVYRILIPGGKIKIIAPYYSSIRAWQDPTHRRAISDATFLYFNKGWRDANRLDHYNIKSDFDFEYGYDISNIWANKHEEARNYGITHYINIINDIHVTLTKRKIE